MTQVGCNKPGIEVNSGQTSDKGENHKYPLVKQEQIAGN